MTEGWRGRLAHCLAVTVVVAGITHLVAVLIMSGHGRTSAYALLSGQPRETALGTVAPVPGGTGAAFIDPALAGAACLYDLRQGSVAVSIDVGADHFAVLSIHDRYGRVLASVTNDAGKHMILTLSRSLPSEARRANEATGVPSTIVAVEGSEPQGFAMAEVLARAPSEQDETATLASALSCRVAPP